MRTESETKLRENVTNEAKLKEKLQDRMKSLEESEKNRQAETKKSSELSQREKQEVEKKYREQKEHLENQIKGLKLELTTKHEQLALQTNVAISAERKVDQQQNDPEKELREILAQKDQQIATLEKSQQDHTQTITELREELRQKSSKSQDLQIIPSSRNNALKYSLVGGLMGTFGTGLLAVAVMWFRLKLQKM